MKDFKSILKKASKKSTHLVLNPGVVDKLIAEGLIKKRFITYQEYFENLIKQKNKNAINLLKNLPLLDETIGNNVISNIYEEIRASYCLGIFTSTIFNSIVLLEYSMRKRIFDERLKKYPNSKWEDIEKSKMKDLIQELRLIKIINKDERIVLDNFNDKFRNAYMHGDIYKMIRGIYINNVKRVDIKTQKINVLNNLEARRYPQFWFLAKNLYDKTYVIEYLNFCIKWTNKLLKN